MREATRAPAETAVPERRAPRLRDHPLLLALCVGGPVVETTLLSLLGPAEALSLAPQATAPAPFGIFHDVRWLLVYHRSWAMLAVGAVLLLAARTVLTTATVRAAWPRDLEPPPLGRLLAHQAAFTVAMALLLAPWAVLLFGVAMFSFSWPFFAAVPTVLGIALLVQHGPVGASWWRRPPPLRAVGWAALTFGVMTLSAAAMWAGPAAAHLPVAAAAGLFNAWAWFGITSVAARRAAARSRPVPIAPAGLAVLAAVVVLGVIIGFAAGGGTPPRGRPAATPHGRPVLVIGGFGSGWERGEQLALRGPFAERRFSYRGLGADGVPLPYHRDDTFQALPELTRLFGEQVADLHRDTGRPVAIVAESQGALIAKAYLAAHPEAPVDDLVMLSPLLRPARVYYPPEGEQGWGVGGGIALRWMVALIRELTEVPLPADAPLPRSIVDHAALLRGLTSCPVGQPPGKVSQLAILPLADAVAAQHPPGVPMRVLPGFHGRLIQDREVLALVSRYLVEGELPPSPRWVTAELAVQAAASGWQVPELLLPLNPAWHVPGGTGAEGTYPWSSEPPTPTCQEIATGVRRWLG